MEHLPGFGGRRRVKQSERNVLAEFLAEPSAICSPVPQVLKELSDTVSLCLRTHGLVIGTILLMHVRDDVIDGHRINQEKLMATGRMAGNMYCHTGDRFEMVRPVYDSEKSLSTYR